MRFWNRYSDMRGRINNTCNASKWNWKSKVRNEKNGEYHLITLVLAFSQCNIECVHRCMQSAEPFRWFRCQMSKGFTWFHMMFLKFISSNVIFDCSRRLTNVFNALTIFIMCTLRKSTLQPFRFVCIPFAFRWSSSHSIYG